ncbi:hypothetical protein LTR56_022902 [Elasticomyces elasticus]|nr:hypothetical protein LTR56_022902 [Elasticomyces elasticus]KAK3627210.1 hypothetical protein LTR22_022860 [Elasticomyces elasticus]KAK4928485.1 hypothetical protein LTR49_004892 [Elasticomyces elasticus]KAK5753593.1 hypothetical protein LTS12_016329 [Elasticomyces elasticus]
MSRKRSASEMDSLPARPRRAESKRTKISPSYDDRSDSSIPSTGSVSVASALESSPSASHRRNSSISSMESSSRDDSDSSLSSSSDETSDEDSDDEPVVTIGAPKKPAIAKTKEALLGGAHDLSARISALLPQLAAANSALEAGGENHSLEEVEDGEQHIEMNLGLGVLEEKGDGSSESSGYTSDDDSEHSDAGDTPLSSVTAKRKTTGHDTDVLGRLMGHKRARKFTGVQALD